MSREEFIMMLRQLLQKTSLRIRKEWSEKDLFIWWCEAEIADGIQWYRRGLNGNRWHYIRLFCVDYYGKNAVA